MINIEQCPVCGSKQISPFLTLSDYFLSGESFCIVQCDQCTFRFTNPRPDDNELGKYYESREYISHSNTKQGLFSIVYQSVRRHTIRSKYKLISTLSGGNSILDIGCATGELIHYFATHGWNVTGIEPNKSARNFARTQYGLKVEDENFLVDALAGSFDVVTMWHVLEHVPDINPRINEIKLVLKDSGTLLIAVPNPESPDALFYGKHWAGYDVPRHLHHFTKNAMYQLLHNHGLEVVREIPMKFDSFYVSLLSEKYLHGKRRWIAAFLSGIRSNRKAKKKNNYSSMIFVVKKEKT
jgi:2-polyprenyl-3-methyl-5-hydroxy-6-metoxy-1,4-benzoquinol methylase